MEDMIHGQHLETLQLAAHGVQLFREGWIAERDPQETAPPGEQVPPTIRQVVLIHKGEVSRLADFLGLVVDNFHQKPVQSVWKESLDKVTHGDVSINPQMELRQLLEIHLRIKVRPENSLLALKFDELGGIEPSRLLRLRMDLKKCAYRLADALKEIEADYRPVPVGETGRYELERYNEHPRRYWWFAEGREDGQKEARAWLDRDMLP